MRHTSRSRAGGHTSTGPLTSTVRSSTCCRPRGVTWLPGRHRISAARMARSAQPSRGRELVRCSTATSCRSTSSSASLEAGGRPGRTSQPPSRTKMRQSRRRDTNDHDAPLLTLVIAAAHGLCRLLAPRRREPEAGPAALRSGQRVPASPRRGAPYSPAAGAGARAALRLGQVRRMLRQCAGSPVLAVPRAGGGRGGHDLRGPAGRGPVIAGDAAAGAGHLVVPDDGGRPVRATRPRSPVRFSHARDQLTGPSPGRRAHIADSGRVAARCLVVIRATRSTSSGRAAFSLAVRMMTSQVLGDSGLRNFPKGDSLHPNGVPFQSCQDHCREPATNNKR
jgi:hypothetical protein